MGVRVVTTTKHESKIEKRQEKEKKAQPKIMLESFDCKPDPVSLKSSLRLPFSLKLL